MAQGKKPDGAERSVYTLPAFAGKIRARFAGCCKILGKTQTEMCEEAIIEWMAAHAEEFEAILKQEMEELLKMEGVDYSREEEVTEQSQED